jgi:hypothetical protein
MQTAWGLAIRAVRRTADAAYRLSDHMRAELSKVLLCMECRVSGDPLDIAANGWGTYPTARNPDLARA